jgi:hypothetical protein
MATNMSSSLNRITSVIENQAAMKTPSKSPSRKKRITREYCFGKIEQTRKEQEILKADNNITPQTKRDGIKMFNDRKQKWMKKALAVESSDEELDPK